jgi:YD repeat-containing protein
MHRFCLIVVMTIFACAFAVAANPIISSISPNPAGINQSVTITGSNFGTSGSVTFTGVTASTTGWTSTVITATVPVGAAPGNVVVTVNGISSNGFPFTLNNGPVSYVYDDLGRLAAVIDVNGNAAEYSYDAVGNIQSISRFTAGQVSIINFSPESGPVGTAVTINGTGFSSTAAQNTVNFNGTAAVVSSATNSQLQVTVPMTATTGPISVTSPSGSATSTGNFTVTPSNGVPTITSFSPTVGVTGTAVSLVGTNFDPTLANDKLRMNASQAVVSAVTSTTMTTTVPPATASGRFTLVAPAGNAVSSQDFYVPFSTHLPSDIGLAARITPGGSQLVTMPAGKIAMVLFDGIEGQHVDIGWSGNYSICYLYLVPPDNSVTSAIAGCTGGGQVSAYLRKSGTYTIVIDPQGSSGSLTLSLSGDVVGTIAIGGPPVTVTTTNPGQDVRLSFAATAGQRVVVYATNVTNPNAAVNLVAQSGSIVTVMFINNTPSGQLFFMDTPISQSLGSEVYQLWIQHNGTNVGSETLQIVPDFAGTLTIPAAGTTGAAIQVPTSGNLPLGQSASLTFSATAGQRVSFNLNNSTFPQGSCHLYLYDPNGNQLLPASPNGYGCGWVDTVPLALTGTYRFSLSSSGTGSISISINNDQDVTTPHILIGGSAVNVATTAPGQDIRLSFTTTTTNKRVVIYATNVISSSTPLNLMTPAGTIQAGLAIGTNPGYTYFIDTQTLAAIGTYQLWIPHSQNDSSLQSETLQMGNVPADVSHTVTMGGSTYPFSTVAGQNANIMFSNATSRSVTVHWTSGNYLSTLGCLVKVTGPSPSTTQVGSGNCNTTTGTISLGTISSGTYNILVDPQQWNAGGMSLTVTTP